MGPAPVNAQWSFPTGIGECGMNGVAKGIEDCRHLGRGQAPVHPDNGRQRHILGEGTVNVDVPIPVVLMHRCLRPARQLRKINDRTGRTPPPTRPPTASVTADPSSPRPHRRIRGQPATRCTVLRAHGSQPSMCRSRPQMPVASHLGRASPRPTPGIGTSVSSSPGPGLVLTSGTPPSCLGLDAVSIARPDDCRSGSPCWEERQNTA